MIKKTMTYVDFNGAERTEDFFFHLSKPEFMRMVAKIYPDVLIDPNANNDEYMSIINKTIENKSPADLVDLFEYLLLTSYGMKTADGKRFEKTPELKNKFSQSPAYDMLFMDLLTNPEEMNGFLDGVMSGGISAQMKEKMQNFANNQSSLSIVG